MSSALPTWVLEVTDTAVSLWPVLAAALTVLLAVTGTTHVLLNKAQSRAAVGWVGLLWLSPFVGAEAKCRAHPVWKPLNRIWTAAAVKP